MERGRRGGGAAGTEATTARAADGTEAATARAAAGTAGTMATGAEAGRAAVVTGGDGAGSATESATGVPRVAGGGRRATASASVL